MMSNHPWLYLQLFISTFCCIYGLQEKLLFSTKKKLKEIDLDTGVVTELVNLSTSSIYSIAYDVKEQYVYASIYNKNRIVRFPYPNDQTVQFEIVVSTNSPFSLAFDSVNGHLYWTENTSLEKIMRCNSDGSYVTPIVTAYDSLALTLDTHSRLIYYSEGNAVHKVTFDGIKQQVVVTSNLTARPIGIDIDFADKRVYWMEYDTGDLKSALYNGSDVKKMFSTNVIGRNREIDIGGDYVFYTSYKNILKIHKSSGQIPAIVHQEPLQIFGLLFYKQENSGAVVPLNKAISIVITIATVGILNYLL